MGLISFIFVNLETYETEVIHLYFDHCSFGL
jgi:hypothetical protein